MLYFLMPPWNSAEALNDNCTKVITSCGSEIFDVVIFLLGANCTLDSTTYTKYNDC